MKILDPGHLYEVEEYDSNLSIKQTRRYMKRIGDKFPGNKPPSYSGTNCQEEIRVLIDRVMYLNNQKPCLENKLIIENFRKNIELFENRALREKNLPRPIWPLEIEKLIPCKICGHIYPHTCPSP